METFKEEVGIFQFWKRRQNIRAPKKNNLGQNKKRILDLGNNTIAQIRIVSLIVSTVFTYLAITKPFKKIFTEQISSIEFSLIFKLLLILLFYSKVSGILTDIKEMQRELKVYKYKIPFGIYVCGILYSINFIGLLFFVDNLIMFCALLSFLYVIYLLFWQILTPFSLDLIKETYKYNTLNCLEIDKLQNKIMYSYFSGYWVKDVVYYVIAPSLAGIILFFSKYDLLIDNSLKVTSRGVIISSMIFLGACISEVIVWTKRLKRKYQIRYLDQNYEAIVQRFK